VVARLLATHQQDHGAVYLWTVASKTNGGSSSLALGFAHTHACTAHCERATTCCSARVINRHTRDPEDATVKTLYQLSRRCGPFRIDNGVSNFRLPPAAMLHAHTHLPQLRQEPPF